MTSEPAPLPPAAAPAAGSPAPVSRRTTPSVADDGGWHTLPAAANRLAAITGGVVGLMMGGAAGIGLGIAVRPGFFAAMTMAMGLAILGIVLGAMLGRARNRRTRWRLDAGGLRVRRGLVWHSELLVPRSRVQHLDLERGPLERGFGLATLIVHTAGTRLHALRQAGFADADAVALRDALLPEKEHDDDVL